MQPNNQPSDELLRAVADDPAPQSSDRLDVLREECRRARDDVKELADLESRVEEVKARRTQRLRETIPDLMDQAGVTGVVLPEEGNLPSVKVDLRPHYSANIAASWDPARRAASLRCLEEYGAGDLIKTTLIIRFPREKRDDATKISEELQLLGHDVEVTEAVASQTLTKWLKDLHKASMSLPPLDAIGGFVGRTAVIKEVDR